MIYGYARVSTGAQDLTGATAQLKAAGCQKVFREKITGTTADRPQPKKLMVALGHGDVVIIPAVDRLSRDRTDLLVIAREMQHAGAGIRSLAEPFLDTTSDFAEIVFAILGSLASPRSLNIAASRSARHGVALTRRPRASNLGASRSSLRTSSARHQAARRGRRNVALDSSQLQCQPADDFPALRHEPRTQHLETEILGFGIPYSHHHFSKRLGQSRARNARNQW
jgi:hypothetical protein